MNELRETIIDILSGYFTVDPKRKHEAYGLIRDAIDSVLESLGACEVCDGKGYTIDWVSADIGQNQDPVHGRFCDCRRGVQLRHALHIIQE